MSEWTEVQLDEIISFNPKVTLRKGEFAKKVPMEALVPFSKKITQYSIEQFTGGTKFQLNDTLMARITPSLENGKTAFVDFLAPDEAGFGSTEFIVLRSKPGLTTPHYIYYLCISPSIRDAAIKSMTGTSGRQRVQDIVLRKYKIRVPELNEQESIAEVLSSIDDKIDLLNRQNETLEAMAQTLFRQWFIEEADESWGEVELNDCCSKISSGGTPKTSVVEYYEGNVPWFSTKELKDGYLFESEKTISEEAIIQSSAKLFPENTVVIAIYAAPTVGRLGILTKPSAFNQAACGLVANPNVCCPEFLYLQLLNDRGILNSLASGTAQQNLNVGKIKSYKIHLPPKEVMAKFKSTVSQVFDKIRLNSLNIKSMNTLRDTLLPKLMSGEARLKLD